MRHNPRKLWSSSKFPGMEHENISFCILCHKRVPTFMLSPITGNRVNLKFWHISTQRETSTGISSSRVAVNRHQLPLSCSIDTYVIDRPKWQKLLNNVIVEKSKEFATEFVHVRQTGSLFLSVLNLIYIYGQPDGGPLTTAPPRCHCRCVASGKVRSLVKVVGRW